MTRYDVSPTCRWCWGCQLETACILLSLLSAEHLPFLLIWERCLSLFKIIFFVFFSFVAKEANECKCSLRRFYRGRDFFPADIQIWCWLRWLGHKVRWLPHMWCYQWLMLSLKEVKTKPKRIADLMAINRNSSEIIAGPLPWLQNPSPVYIYLCCFSSTAICQIFLIFFPGIIHWVFS